ncbi:hypothetical protein [Pantoea rodasii]|uniref:hypothetical protein n=1 Tax=Pantoea rodasii TaxID=1076549 RepID=UPI0012E0A929|nr:hypothetical protein [Pantoea rodasii]
MNKLLKTAIENLAIHTVSLRDSHTEIGEGYNSLNINGAPKKNQSFRTVVKIEVVEMKKEGDDSPPRLFYSFHYEVGSRLVSLDHSDEESSEQEDHGALATIEARFEAIYRAKRELDKDELQAFAARNVGYNVWPYWREYLQGTCNRMGINPIRVPFYYEKDSDLPSEVSE